MTTIIDTDKGGQGFQKQRVYLGPSLGWSEEFVQPSSVIVSASYNVQPGDGLLLVDAPGPVTINLPDVVKWFQQPADQPATGWNRQLCIKDYGGHASLNPITVVPFGAQNIDKTIGPTTINVDHAVFLLVPNVNLTGWIIAAGTTSVLIPVGTYLPVHDPAATGKLTVRELGGDIAYMQGSPAGGQAVNFGADAASADADVNVNFFPKGIGGNLFYSQGALQVSINGAAGVNKFLVLSGGTTAGFPTIASSFGGRINIRDSARVGPVGGNQAFIDGSVPGQQAISYQADPLSVDTNVNIHLIPKNAGGVNLYSSNTLQLAVTGLPTTNRYLVIAGGSSVNDPLIAVASGGSIRMDDSILVGPAGGNFAGMFGSAAGQQAIVFSADNVANPDADINVHIKPKNNGGVNLYSNGALQALAAGPAGALRSIVLSGSVAGNPAIGALGGGNVQIDSLVMTGTPTAPTVTPSTDASTKVATTAFVQSAMSVGIGDVTKAGNNIFTGNNYFTSQQTIFGSNITGDATVAVTPQFINDFPTIMKFSADALGGSLGIRKSRSATVGAHAIVQNNDTLGTLTFSGSDGTNYANAVQLQAYVDGTPSAGVMPAGLLFATRGTSGGVTGRGSIDSTGYLAWGAGMLHSFDPGNDSIAGFSGGRISVFSWNPSISTGGMYLRLSRGGSTGAHVAVVAGDASQINFSGSDGTNFIGACAISMGVDPLGTVSSGVVPGAISFLTRLDSGGNLVRARIDKTGQAHFSVNGSAGPFAATSVGSTIFIDGLTGGVSGLAVTNFQNAAGSSFLNLRHSRSGVLGTFAALSANDPIGTVCFQAPDFGATAWVNAVQIQAMVTGAGSGSHVAAKINFLIDDGTTFITRFSMWPAGGFSMGSLIATDPGAGIIVSNGIRGLNDGADAPVGCIGEYTDATGTGVALTANTQTNVTSFSLTAGDWDIEAHANFSGYVSATNLELEISSVSATISGAIRSYVFSGAGAGINVSLAIPMFRYKFGATQTVYLVARSSAAASVTGVITARRVH